MVEVVRKAPTVPPESTDVGTINLKVMLYFKDGDCQHLPSPVSW